MLSITSPVFGQPVVESVAPSILRAGQATEITLQGKELAGISTIWLSAGKGEVAKEPAKNGENPAQVVLKIDLPAMPPGLLGLRVATAKGVSELMLLLVDDLPCIVDGGQNKSSANAQVVSLPACISARISGKGERRFYRFTAKDKMRATVDVFAHRIGERFDPVATLYDSAGQEIASCDDDRATRQDARFVAELPAAGDYTLEIRDIRYREGRFAVRIGDIPLVNPPLAPPATLSTAPPRWPVQSAKEPNDQPTEATPISLPAIIEGSIESGTDRDLFRLTLKKGKRILLRNLSRSQFSPGDFLLRILKDDGSRLAEIDDRETNGESQLDFTPPADGTFLLSVEESDRAGSADCRYRLEILPANEGVRLRAKVDRFVARPGGTVALLLERERASYEGPIEISLAEPIAGFELANRIHSKKSGEERLLITVPSDGKAGDLRTFKLQAKAAGSSGPGELVSTETIAPGAPRRFLLAPQLDGTFALSIAGEALPLFALRSAATEIPFDRASGQAKLTLAIDRTHKDYKEVPLILAEGLPQGATIEGKKKSDTEIEVVITAPKDLPPGKHAFKILGYGEFQGRGHKSAIDGMTMSVP